MIIISFVLFFVFYHIEIKFKFNMFPTDSKFFNLHMKAHYLFLKKNQIKKKLMRCLHHTISTY